MAAATLRPPFPYFGGKMSVAERIVALLPPHRHYVEPYGGSLAVLMAKRPVPIETVNDLDARLMLFWRVLRERPDELIRACVLTPHARGEHAAARAATVVDGNELETARRVWVTLTQGIGRALTGRKTGWRHYIDPAGTTYGMPMYLEAYAGRLATAAERLHRVSLECRPALDVIARYGTEREVLLYVDPPYLGTARSSNNAEYPYEMRDKSDHRELAAALVAARSAVVVSGYHSPLYDELFAGWDRTELSSYSGNAAPGTQARTEVLWSNRPLRTVPTLFDGEAV
jgi:DNA adenine methylase